MDVKHFFRLHEELQHLSEDPATADDPIKRMFLCDGEHVSANVSILKDTGDAIHVQRSHDELVLIVSGECGFRVGEQVQRVTSGDLIFIPRDSVHGPIIDNGPIALLSIFAPFFDRTKRNIAWSKDDFVSPPHNQFGEASRR